MISRIRLFLKSLMGMLWGEKENKTLPDFLEALAVYTEDIQGYYDNTDAKCRC